MGFTISSRKTRSIARGAKIQAYFTVVSRRFGKKCKVPGCIKRHRCKKCRGKAEARAARSQKKIDSSKGRSRLRFLANAILRKGKGAGHESV